MRVDVDGVGIEYEVAGPWRYERLGGPGHWMQIGERGCAVGG